MAALLARAAGLRQERRYDEAAHVLRQALAISPRATAAYAALGEVEFRRGNYVESIRAYRRLMAEYPHTYSAELHRQVGLVELRAGMFPHAVRDLREAVALDPADWLAYHLLGHACARMGDRPCAADAWRRALTLNPGFQPARDQLEKIDALSP